MKKIEEKAIPMSELIAQLQQYMEEHGDIKVLACTDDNGLAPITLGIEKVTDEIVSIDLYV